MTNETDTVEVYGMKDGIQVHLGQFAMPPRMKAKELAIGMFGYFDEHDNMDDSTAALCFACMEELLQYVSAQEKRGQGLQKLPK